MLPRKSILILITSVVLLVGAAAWARERLLGPAMRTQGAERIARRLAAEGKLQEGDIIFQNSRSRQSRAIAQATNSPWTHCGLLVHHKGRWLVYEAVGPVKSTPLEQWLERGHKLRFSLKRLRPDSHPLDSSALAALQNEGRRFQGRPYDFQFGWSDASLYCSELVWKVYHRALGLSLGTIQTLSDLNLSNPATDSLRRSRLGDAPLPTDSLITPAALHAAPQLQTIAENP